MRENSENMALVLCFGLILSCCAAQTILELPTKRLDQVGIGYNILLADPMLGQGADPGLNLAYKVFNFTWKLNKTTQDSEWLIPDQLSSALSTACNFTTTTYTYNGMQSYYNSQS